jgi:hypothetical protein
VAHGHPAIAIRTSQFSQAEQLHQQARREAEIAELWQLSPCDLIAMLELVDTLSMELRVQELAAQQLVHG